MKKTKLKILATALSFFALSATFGQVDSSKSNVTPGDSLNRSVPQGSPVATDSTSVNQNSNSVSTDPASTSTDKADKKREKAAKKEAKAEKKEGQ